MFRNGLQPMHLLLLVVVIVVLFGYKRLPDMTRSLGRSMRIFKSEMNEMKQDGTGDPGRSRGEDASRVAGHSASKDSATSAVRERASDRTESH